MPLTPQSKRHVWRARWRLAGDAGLCWGGLMMKMKMWQDPDTLPEKYWCVALNCRDATVAAPSLS